MSNNPSNLHGHQVELLGLDPWGPDHFLHMTTCASWYERKVKEPGYLRVKDPKGLRTGLSRAGPVLQDVTFIGSSYLGQRDLIKQAEVMSPR